MLKLQLLLSLIAVFAFVSCGTEESSEQNPKQNEGAEQASSLKKPSAYTSTVWLIDNLENIGGNGLTVLGDPQVIDAPFGKALFFDGVDDGVVIDAHPLEGAEIFTLEVLFRPDADGLTEQRFFHLQEDGAENRVLVETRLTGDGHWYLDTFIKSGETNSTLKDEQYLHPVDEWYNATLVFDGVEMRHYVNGVLELSAKIDAFTPPKAGKTSAGVRINQVHWFKGAIGKARFTRAVLAPDEFMKLQ